MGTLLQNAKILGVEVHDCYDDTTRFFPIGSKVDDPFDRALVNLVYEHHECITQGSFVASFRYSN